jgi:general secretion pathway protein L
MTVIIVRFPSSDVDDPALFRVTDGVWEHAGLLSEFMPSADDETVMAVVSPEDVRCSWFSLQGLEARQAEGVAKLRATEQSLGLVHSSAAQYVGDDYVTATIAPEVMQYGLDRLAARGVNPDIVLPFALVIDPPADMVVTAEFEGLNVLRSAQFAVPDEPVFRSIFAGDTAVEILDAGAVRTMLLKASAQPLLNLRAGIFAKKVRSIWATAAQLTWIKRLCVALVVVSALIMLLTLGKYWSATNNENSIALAAAQKVDPAITDIDQAEAQLAAAMRKKGIMQGRFSPLSAALWRSVKASPNVSVREMRFGQDGILTVVLAAPSSDNINQTLLAIQQDGYPITATPRSDATGATLVDLTMRMP